MAKITEFITRKYSKLKFTAIQPVKTHISKISELYIKDKRHVFILY